MNTWDQNLRRVIIALDFPETSEANAFLARWDKSEKPFVKVGMQLFYAAGPRWVSNLVEEGYPVFLDVKLHDIPHTVAGGVRSLARLGVEWITLHASGGIRMMEAAKEAAETITNQKPPHLLAVTQLTSTDQQMMNHELGIPGTVQERVLAYAQLAKQAGMAGVVCSGWEATKIKSRVDSTLITVTPGIRLAGQDQEDQKRVMTPEQAVQSGADYLVVGRPITQAKNPVAMYESITRSIEKVQ